VLRHARTAEFCGGLARSTVFSPGLVGQVNFTATTPPVLVMTRPWGATAGSCGAISIQRGQQLHARGDLLTSDVLCLSLAGFTRCAACATGETLANTRRKCHWNLLVRGTCECQECGSAHLGRESAYRC
jgi:hypothetical protein